MTAGALAGVRVIELGGIGPAPYGAMLLADLGADVTRYQAHDGERPGSFRKHDLQPFGGRMRAPAWPQVPALVDAWLEEVWNLRAGGEAALFDRAAIHDEIQRFTADATVVEQDAALGRRPVARQPVPLLFEVTQQFPQRLSQVLNPPREGSALCQGIIHCGSCGKPMRTNYHSDQRPPTSAAPAPTG